MHVAGKPIHLGDYQRRVSLAALCERGKKLRVVGVLTAAFNFGELGKRLVLSQEVPGGLALRV